MQRSKEVASNLNQFFFKYKIVLSSTENNKSSKSLDTSVIVILNYNTAMKKTINTYFCHPLAGDDFDLYGIRSVGLVPYNDPLIFCLIPSINRLCERSTKICIL